MRIFPLLALLALPACARPTSPPAHAAHGGERRELYRLDYVISATNAPGHATTETFTQVLEEESAGYVHAGDNVPLLTSANVASPPRQDTGLKVKSLLRRSGDGRLVLSVDFELSATGDPSQPSVSIRKVSTNGMALLVPGTPTSIFRLEEGQKHYDLAVTATRL